MQEEEKIQIEKLYNELLEAGAKKVPHKDYEVLECKDLKIKTLGNKYVDLKYLSRHKTSKHLLELKIFQDELKKDYSVKVTTDHVCMIYNKDHFFENTNAKNLKVNQYVSVYDEKSDEEYVGTLKEIVDLGQTDEWVYDCEVDDEMHSFYADDVLVHNSQFIDLTCITEKMKEKYGFKDNLDKWPKKYKRELWNVVSQFIEEEVNPYVRNLIHTYCHTNGQDVLSYELEYMSSQGVYESKKHYFTHKIIEEGDDVDKNKTTGIELKKNTVPKEMKKYLEEIYVGVVNKEWTEKQFQDYVSDLYDRFTQFNINEVSFWKGYNTGREANGFLEMETGTTGIAKSCSYFNQIIEKLGLGKKYDQIRVGEKVRQCYIKKNNKYAIDTIAFKDGQWPKEFNDLFEIDYQTMFNKLILDPLKRFRQACHFGEFDPSKQVLTDIFEL